MFKLIRVAGYLLQYKGRFLLTYGCMIGATAFSLAIPWYLGTAIDTVLGESTLSKLLGLAGLILLISFLRGVLSYGQQYLNETLSQRVALHLRNHFVERLEHLSFAFHDSQKTGDLMSKGTYDVEMIRGFITAGLISLPGLILMMLGVVGLLMFTNWQLGLISLSVVPIAVFIALKVSYRLRKIFTVVQRETGRLTTVLQENLTGMRLVKAFGAEENEKTKFNEVAFTVGEETFKATSLFVFRTTQLYLFFTGITGIILWYGGNQVVGGTLSPGELVRFILFLGLLMMPVRMLGFTISSFARAIPAAERIFQVLDAESPVKEKPNAQSLNSVKSQVKFQDVFFNYLPSVEALRGISFEAKPGQKIALVGPPGSGKSTIAQLIPRFYDVTKGIITIDNMDIRDVTLASLRKVVGIVFQDVFHFSATIRDNIAYGAPDVSEEQIIAAAKAAQLHDFITGLPNGYENWLGERGVTLSGGQRQRLAIARTLLLNPPILILDDSTSSVDAGTDHLIQQALEKVMENRTTFIIAHRIGSLKIADLILVIQDGQIVEQGIHQELVDQKGIYREIYDLQILPEEKGS